MYNNELIKIKERVLQENGDVQSLEGKNRLSFLQSKTTKRMYFPQLTNYDPFDFYIKVKTNQALSDHDLDNYIDIKENVSLNYNSTIFNNSTIYCSFHYGSYKLISCILHEKNVNFAVVANKVILDSAKKRFIALHESELVRSDKKLDLQFIDANSNSGIVKMIRTLKEGKSLLIYIDGGNGLHGLNNNGEKTTTVNFLNEKIYSRTGVAFLSNYLKVPIVPVISQRDPNYGKINVTFFDAIDPTINTDAVIALTTQKLWNIFSEKVVNDPTQWEGILYANHFLLSDNKCERTEIQENIEYKFNNESFDFLTVNDNESFLYDYRNSLTFKLSKKINDLLYLLNKSDKPYLFSELLEVVHKEVLKDLIIKQILISI